MVFVPPGNYMSSELQLRRDTALVGSPSWDYRRPEDPSSGFSTIKPVVC